MKMYNIHWLRDYAYGVQTFTFERASMHQCMYHVTASRDASKSKLRLRPVGGSDPDKINGITWRNIFGRQEFANT